MFLSDLGLFKGNMKSIRKWGRKSGLYTGAFHSFQSDLRLSQQGHSFLA